MMRLALGTVQFGLPYGIANQTGQIPRGQAIDMIKIAASRGIDTLDTAIAYGTSEVSLGEIGIQDFKVVTKLPALPEGLTSVADWVHQEVDASMKRLGTPALYGLLLHRPEQLLGPYGAELNKVLMGLRESEQVQKVGISIYSPSELDAISPRFSFDLVQSPFSVIDRRLQRSGWLARLKAAGVEIHTRSAFLQGLLTMSEFEQSSRFPAWSDRWKLWHQWLQNQNASAIWSALAFPLSFSEVDRVVVGADNVTQLEQLISFAKKNVDVELPDLSCDSDDLINPSHWPVF